MNALLIKLGGNIREIRLSCSLSQEELAFDAGLDRSYVGGVERGERNLSIMNLCKIALALHTTPSNLLKDIAFDRNTEITTNEKNN